MECYNITNTFPDHLLPMTNLLPHRRAIVTALVAALSAPLAPVHATQTPPPPAAATAKSTQDRPPGGDLKKNVSSLEGVTVNAVPGNQSGNDLVKPVAVL